MDITTANLISYTYPANFDESISTSAAIVITFIRDMDSTTFSDTTIALEVIGTVARVPVSYSYSDKELTITPNNSLQPLTSYQLIIVGDTNPINDSSTGNITGIKDILGNGMIGTFKLIFTTSSQVPLSTPTPIIPVPQSAVLSGSPVFEWTSVAGASGYQVHIATTNTFENIIWPQDPWNWSTAALSVIPGSVITIDNEYWWRVRALDGAGYGAWSQPYNFYYGDPTQGYVSPQDNPFGLIPPGVVVPKVVATSPLANTNNILPNNFPTVITATLNIPVDPGTLTNSTIWVCGEPVDGIFNSASFKPIFSPSLNGAIYQSGGITAPAPVDAYQQILVSGMMEPLNGPTVSTDSLGNSTISLSVPAGYIQNNNIYTVHIEVPELYNPVKFVFSSQWSPAFSSPSTIRYMVNHFIPGLTDEEILFHIRRNSLNAIFLQVYPPTQMDGEEWYYQPPVSFDVSNPPFFVREYVRLQTIRDFLMTLLFSLLTVGRVTLGDLTVDQGKQALKQSVEFAVDQIDKELAPFLDKLHGHTARGWGRGDWVQRSERLKHWAAPAGYPYHHRGLQF